MRLFVSCARKSVSQSVRATRTPLDRRPISFARERENVGQEGLDALVHRGSPQARCVRLLGLFLWRSGYNYEAVKIFMPAGAKKPVYAPYVEHMPPDTTACIFWMKNRMPEKWRDVQNVVHVLGKYMISD